jgi:hypothetical protein
MTRSPTLEIPDSQIGQDDLGQGSTLTTTQEPSDFIFDVSAEEDQQLTKPIIQHFPSSPGVRNLATLPELPQPATRETGSERKMESWDAHEDHNREVIGERHSAAGLQCQVSIYATHWLPRAVVETELLRRFRKRQRVEKAVPTRRSLR